MKSQLKETGDLYYLGKNVHFLNKTNGKIESEQFYLTELERENLIRKHFGSVDKLYDFINGKTYTIYAFGFNLIVIIMGLTRLGFYIKSKYEKRQKRKKEEKEKKADLELQINLLTQERGKIQQPRPIRL